MSQTNEAEPRVSVVIAVKNAEAFLGEALDSIDSQTRPVTEILVVDGRSTDRSREIASSHSKARVLLEEGTGFAGAWNQGIRAAVGDYIAILDSDDLWRADKLELQVAALEADPECGYSIAKTRFLRMEGCALPPGFDRVDLEKDHTSFFPSVMLARRSLFDEVGFFEEDWAISSDVEWIRRVRDHGIGHVVIPEVLMTRRIHNSNISYKPPDVSSFKREILSILKTSLDRRRGGADPERRD